MEVLRFREVFQKFQYLRGCWSCFVFWAAAIQRNDHSNMIFNFAPLPRLKRKTHLSHLTPE